ncbi:iron chelate uptake ABC transporter family permease subunit [Stenotrophomonas maltophilia]|uniref:iron chelate uptake ABC transporter family permease subunit n=1 Tax=Stenotrophomonas maltophilia TaxID=40324 RepID=UPI001D0FAB46|nr:iron chelate uptake ABC transporter family permease subunit [Stenotrophomonas maltophilia]UXB29266.1 iron chelate uptake ABC transporter family permease subunit [Stenotrophomonas maltophilia]
MSMQISPSLRQSLLVMIAIASALAFMTVQSKGNWAFVIPFRGGRLAVVVLVAGCIAVSSVLFQTITQNNILTPSIMGFDAVYVLMQTLSIFLFRSSNAAVNTPLLAFAINVLLMVGAGMLMWTFIRRSGARSLHLLLLTGVVFSLLVRSVSGLLMRLIDPNDFMLLQDTLFANFNSVELSLLPYAATLAVAVIVMMWHRRFQYDVALLGKDASTGLGLDHGGLARFTFVAVSVLVAVSTALVGPILFLGLLASNMAYRVTGTRRHAVTLPAAFLIALIAILGGQLILERFLSLGTVVTVVIDLAGGLVFLALVLKRSRLC